MSLYYDELIAADSLEQIDLKNQKLSETSNTNAAMKTPIDKSESSLVDDLGFPLEQLFQMARQFLKEKQGSRAIQLKYADTIRFAALSKQATMGKWDSSHTPNVGLLDVVGNDRKQAWISLGEMSKEQAKEEFIKLLLERCPMFRPHIEAHHVDNEEKDRLRKQDENRRALEQQEEKLRQQEIQQVSKFEEQRKKREEFQRKQIQEALNQQTYPQFKAYAEQQYKDNRQAQDELIRQLQEQHFHQYMQQVYQQQLLRTKSNMEPQVQFSNSTSSTSISSASYVNPASSNGSTPMTNNSSMNPVQTQFESLSLKDPLTPPKENSNVQQSFVTEETNDQDESGDYPTGPLDSNVDDPTEDLVDENREYPPIAAANMWTRKDIKEFKDTVRREKDAIIKIGSGETVTVRVPTHEDGRCIFWEFATDYYDIGFGLYFEWTKAQSNTVTVQISDSSEEDEESDENLNGEKKDIEKGASNSSKAARPYQDEIIPIFRRDCHEEIYAGSHPYPGHGVYLLKFDNSYSLWRSKTLYYRVYYSR